MCSRINKNLVFFDSFQLLSASLQSLVKNIGKDNFKYLCEKFASQILDLVNKKGFYPYEYKGGFEKFDEELPSKDSFYSSLINKTLVIETTKMLLKFGINL